MAVHGVSAPRRIESIDVVRGAIMILMALDHVRDFFGVPGNPTNLATASAPLFATRWITHFCAPVFFFLMGTGAFLAGQRRTRGQLSSMLLTRGLWLIVLELTLVRCFAYQFNVDYQVTLLLVLWALGWSLVALSALVWLPVWLLTTIGLVMIAGHNAFDSFRPASGLWNVLHAPGFVVTGPPFTVFASYPLIPWIGVTAVGYALGQIYRWDPDRRRRFLLVAGLAVTLGFVALRWSNLYGDPRPWAAQSSSLFTALSFLNTNKYPPSLLFLMMTLGPALLFLRAADGRTPRWLRPAVIYGQTPLFYFVLHFVAIHVLAVVVCYAKYGAAHWMFESPDLGNYPFTPPPGWGFSLPVVYAVWIGVVIAIYPACRWMAALKARRRDWWMSYV